jgi:signal transduction histidine kinase
MVWFATAVGLLVAGIVGWWRAGAGVALHGWSGGLVIAVWAAAAIILFTGWRRTVAPDAFDAPFMGPLALAASAPLALLPVWVLSPVAAAVASVVAGLVGMPLGQALAGELPNGRRRRRARLLVVAASLGAVAIGLGLMTDSVYLDRWALARWLLASSVAFVPAAMLAAATLHVQGGTDASAAARVLRWVTVVVIGAAPAVTGLCLLTDMWMTLVLPAVAVMLTLLAIGRFALQPLAGLVGTAVSQRDRAVTAADAERARLASVLHDGALAEVALLIQRLDDQGDADAAAMARSIATELRSVSSELRLPILDDLGTGPALEWLVRRLSIRSGAAITIDQRTVIRPAPAVELAFYRVAQEALVNALKHGLPPVWVVYRATPEGAELWVDDSGLGISPDAQARAEREGRLGLASMAQRAEATGSRLTVAVRPDGGTRVSLAWRASTSTPGLLDAPAVTGSAMGVVGAGP